jgi:hypothetical protein
MKFILITVLFTSLITLFSCSDNNGGMKPGWTDENIKSILQCPTEASPAFCDCYEKEMTSKYTPEEVQSPANTTFVTEVQKIVQSCQKSQGPSDSTNVIEGNPSTPPHSPYVPGSSSSSSSYSYEFSVNGCSTGNHTFDSQYGYCEGLKSTMLNNNCAYATRKITYESNCEGTFSETP